MSVASRLVRRVSDWLTLHFGLRPWFRSTELYTQLGRLLRCEVLRDPDTHYEFGRYTVVVRFNAAGTLWTYSVVRGPGPDVVFPQPCPQVVRTAVKAWPDFLAGLPVDSAVRIAGQLDAHTT